jgi:hypothetical protein
MTIENYQEKYAAEGQVNFEKAHIQRLFRFAFEELMRRNFQRKAKEAITDDEGLALLFSNANEFLQSLVNKKQE